MVSCPGIATGAAAGGALVFFLLYFGVTETAARSGAAATCSGCAWVGAAAGGWAAFQAGLAFPPEGSVAAGCCSADGIHKQLGRSLPDLGDCLPRHFPGLYLGFFWLRPADEGSCRRRLALGRGRWSRRRSIDFFHRRQFADLGETWTAGAALRRFLHRGIDVQRWSLGGRFFGLAYDAGLLLE